MAGLNNIISNTAQQTTTLPTWFDTAQQNVVNQAGQAAAAAPTPQNTVAQGAVEALSGPSNAFSQAGGTLQSIASGAANPWITDTSTGQVSPNTDTALGGLFQAQNQQLQQLMPNIQAQPTANAIGSGNFGSLRGDTAVDKATADAIAQMNAAQYQAALQNQSTGVQAGSAAGNVAQQGINNQLTVGQYQQAAPFTNASNYGKVLGGIQAPTTVANQTQLSPLNQIAGLITAAGGASGTSGILNSLGIPGGLAGLWKSISSLGGSSGGVNLPGQGQTTVALPVDPSWGAPVTGTGPNGGAGAGQILGDDGKVYTDPSYGTGGGSVMTNPTPVDPTTGEPIVP